MNCLSNRISSITVIALLIHTSLLGQNNSDLNGKTILLRDTSFVTTKRSHSPSTAAIFSAILPGSGQIYNKKYWKAPIVWGGLAFFGYRYFQENNRYLDAKDAYLQLLDTNIKVKTPFNGTTDLGIVQSSKNIYRTQRDMFMIFGILFYALNIVDAAVDAHLFRFDVSDNLSMKINFDSGNFYNLGQRPTITLNLSPKEQTKKIPTLNYLNSY
jgi:hypothetical protein